VRAALSIGLPGTTDAETLRALAPRIERLGFHALWLNDVPGGDSLAGLRVAASVTSTLGIATGIIPLDRRPAESLELGGLPVARTTLGIGSGAARHPLGLIDRGIHALRNATTSSIVVGALGPRMRRLAAERADGVLFNWLAPAAAAEASADARTDAGARAVRTVLYVRTIADPEARPALEREAARYESVPSYAANFARLGARAMETTLDVSTSTEGLHAFDVVDELVLRAITPNATRAELERFVEHVAESWAR
jgi:alkanesulfonate monooxygenase SsuD/methylene tetrahydromethanopterin reductase-like flavin-dependent oxidoreductase (luciferase family)